MTDSAEYETTTVLSGHTFLEGPRWHDGRIWVSDLYTKRVLSANEDGSDLRVEASLSDQPSGLGWLPDGRLVVMSMLDHALLRREPDGAVVVHADLAGKLVGWGNDIVVDPESGATYVGHFGFDLFAGDELRSTSIWRVGPDGTVTEAADGLYFPNGMVIVDGVLRVNESWANRTTAFDIGDDGALSNRRVWAKYGEPSDATDPFAALGDMVVAPDGSALDSEGALWVADFAHGRVVRVLDGEIVDEVSPGTGVFACALGGSDGRTLFVCTAPSFDPEERKADPKSELVAVRVDVPA
ncbi:MAG: SMP-30/gluconolactonase/LRE family protein [Gordonia sp. (in: high G+C Gram-positive bacteria)]|uniref:SMP-30/gluconolactonase/LRE family protein n=1 Tax=Gordonia sp. (in: high G+C Gram-positive bacteria) TaxID=84139 RepID=UPI0039E2AEB6